jgi:hypothetical protein
MVVIGLDRERAVRELARLAAASEAPGQARSRAATVELHPAGAVDAIVDRLAAERA